MWPQETAPSNSSSIDISARTIYVEWVVHPILLLTCIVGNSLTIAVLIKDEKKTSMHVYLACLAVSDVLLLLLALQPYIIGVQPKILETDANFRQVSVNFRGINYWGREACVQFSDWSLIVFSCERLLATAFPIKFRGKATVLRAIILESVLMILSMVYPVERAVVHYYFLARDNSNITITDPPSYRIVLMQHIVLSCCL
ncbi:hypothetical protein BV898_12850 [Hypsibius exemplaris]|uniref:G-protein coupled receptors family 1 profile domain-containing protein n=1 Tax=Hypsibius exemplaris TaxID=2072580 RepID=A0A1W0WCK8_HYPEX|nr:hypothetical protein BV898_12850 [Hypsibius exemplaris]